MCSSTPSSWQKLVEFKRNLSKWERKKFTKSNHYRYWDLLLIFPFCKSVKLPQFQKGIISTSPLASVPVPVQTTWLETCVWQLAAYRTVGVKIHPSRSWIYGRIWGLTLFSMTCCLLQTKKNPGGIQWGMLLFLSLVPCARSCYWVVLTQSHQPETVQFFLHHINLI